MVVLTLLATIDSVALLCSMTGLIFSCCFTLKHIADLEFDVINTAEFSQGIKKWTVLEHVFLVLNFALLIPFLGRWWMTYPQMLFTSLKIMRVAVKGQRFDERQLLKASYYKRHRAWHTCGLLFYVASWFVYFARFVTAVMDIHVHGISPYD
eukprot:NODE_17155_length_959_cov_3.192308.p1 GENE.NODE_17155_length_959_cov_3.192308~~NODE_17155_length_959_cov_3.192308.p1  ORF type:complete len:152 (+),score=26.79 NODE_17155_length_959_cov_3.192308:240-695(+)